MATIADRIIKSNGTALNAGTVYFVPLVTLAIGGAAVSVMAVSVVTDASGNFSISLTPGAYRVRWRFASSLYPDELTILVPDDAETYTISELQTEVEPVTNVLTAKAGADALRALIVPRNRQVEFLEFYEVDGDGAGGWFKFDSSSEDEESADVIRPDSVASNEPGRWKRVQYI